MDEISVQLFLICRRYQFITHTYIKYGDKLHSLYSFLINFVLSQVSSEKKNIAFLPLRCMSAQNGEHNELNSDLYNKYEQIIVSKRVKH